MTPVEIILVTSAVSGASTLGGKLLWDKLQGGKKNDHALDRCPDHQNCVVSLNLLKQKSDLHCSKLAEGDKRMASIDAKIERVNEKLNSIDTHLAVLVAKSNKKWEDHHAD